ncbi:MAG: class I SAM-dependent methyltransferase [Alphaproteobacteria bacterium]|jgi:SAM-dependent methyltransferase|nr:class I SAM-dependent methyltransferase [Alphaproteobacteria bacterium]MBT5390632.1 class I SAM-dependent methyltransferase [Alphaproteobacteria bacterium]
MNMIEPEKPLTPTLNKMGYMFSDITEYGEAFVDYASQLSVPVVDIAAAYGVATKRALKKGAHMVYANDIDPRHLAILKQNVPENHQHRLKTFVGSFPEELDFQQDSIGAVLIANVFHYLTGPQISMGITRLKSWLQPGGKVFVITGTPYTRMWESYIPGFYEEKKKKSLWPGWFGNIEQDKQVRMNDIPSFMHFFDIEVLERCFVEEGFKVEKIGYIDRKDWPSDMRLDGRESVGLVGVKV